MPSVSRAPAHLAFVASTPNLTTQLQPDIPILGIANKHNAMVLVGQKS
jgi:hypothetical protein